VDVIEILVKKGDTISVDTPLITLESDKASMEIPSTMSGVVQSVDLKVGDKVSEGDIILSIASAEAEPEKPEPQKAENKTETKAPEKKEPAPVKASSVQEKSLEVRIPDIGGGTDIDVIDVMVKVGDEIAKDQSLVTLEGDKATMDIPSPAGGVVEKIALKIGDKVSQGSLVLVMKSSEAVTAPESAPAVPVEATRPEEKLESEQPRSQVSALENTASTTIVSAGPAVRRLARELGVNLADVQGSGRKLRVSKEDINNYVKTKLSEKSTGGFSTPAAPSIDFSKFGEIEVKPLSKIKRLTGVNVHRSWVTIPHVTQFDEADITELEAFRKAETERAKAGGYKLTILAFVCKVVCKALEAYPQFNTSLDARGENLIYKNYFNIGIAVETPNGLVVPVIKDVNRLSVGDIAKEMARLSAKARDKGLMPADMSGGCFTVSSLGGIGGTAFTPIVNGPEVAILGLSRSSMKPVFEDNEFKPRLMLPLSLSYDHRVIDGAEAARFTRFISEGLSDIRRILL
jgi:pyruvate dehydrogenase E2 component (dihydrolipoamide acetyltransferase)